MCQEINAIRRFIEESIVEIGIFQERPVTFIMLLYKDDSGVKHKAYGWSKVMRGDTWDPIRGFEVAFGKATKRAAERLLNLRGEDHINYMGSFTKIIEMLKEKGDFSK